MSLIDTKEIAEAIITKMKEEHQLFLVDPEEHSSQHDFIKLLLEERARKIERQERIKEKIAGSLILSGVLFTIGLIGAGFIDWFRAHIK